MNAEKASNRDLAEHGAIPAYRLRREPSYKLSKGDVQKIISNLRNKLELQTQVNARHSRLFKNPQNNTEQGDLSRRDGIKNKDDDDVTPTTPIMMVQRRWKGPPRHAVDLSLLPSLFRASLADTRLEVESRSNSKVAEEAGNESYKSKALLHKDRVIERYIPKPKEIFIPKKLRRRWPPIVRKASKRAISRSLHMVKTHVRVRSLADSFERLSLASLTSDNALGNDHHSHGDDDTLNDSGEFYSELDDADLSAVPDGSSVTHTDTNKMARKASIRIRWGGPEIFVFQCPRERRNGRKTRTKRRKHPASKKNRVHLTGDRFASTGDVNRSLMLMSPLVRDRFGVSDGGDKSSPNCPARRGRTEWSDTEEWSEDEISLDDGCSSEGISGDSDTAWSSGMETLDDLAVWITAADESMILTGSKSPSPLSSPSSMKWIIKRVWNQDEMDSNEEEELVSEADLMERVKMLLGVQTGAVDSQDADEMMAHWMTMKVWDIDGEIVSAKTEQAMNDIALRLSLNELTSIVPDEEPAAGATCDSSQLGTKSNLGTCPSLCDNLKNGQDEVDADAGDKTMARKVAMTNEGARAGEQDAGLNSKPPKSYGKTKSRRLINETKPLSVALNEGLVRNSNSKQSDVPTSAAGVAIGGQKSETDADGYILTKKTKKNSIMSLLSPPSATFREVEYILEL